LRRLGLCLRDPRPRSRRGLNLDICSRSRMKREWDAFRQSRPQAVVTCEAALVVPVNRPEERPKSPPGDRRKPDNRSLVAGQT
jgi:hypothetical protein